jgi:hypothetical protein
MRNRWIGMLRDRQITRENRIEAENCGAVTTGTLTVNVEPLPSSLQTDTRPPNISVNDLTM